MDNNKCISRCHHLPHHCPLCPQDSKPLISDRLFAVTVGIIVVLLVLLLMAI